MKHIVFLHGLGSHGLTMRFLQSSISSILDHETHSFSYYSITSDIDSITRYMEGVFNTKFAHGDDVCIIGHSLGGIIAAKLASSSLLRCKVSKIITLGTPHYGAILASKIINKLPFIKYVFPIVGELSTNSDKLDYTIDRDCKVGVLSGNKRRSKWNPLVYIGSAIIGNKYINDGVVLLKENGMACHDSICIHVDHINMLWSDAVVKQCVSFINTDKFK